MLQIPSFLDYLGGGMKIQMHYAVDYNHLEDDKDDGERQGTPRQGGSKMYANANASMNPT